jgi:hypothetical protein
MKMWALLGKPGGKEPAPALQAHSSPVGQAPAPVPPPKPTPDSATTKNHPNKHQLELAAYVLQHNIKLTSAMSVRGKDPVVHTCKLTFGKVKYACDGKEPAKAKET